jgi:hypothetical protein
MNLTVKDCKHPWENLQILSNGEVRVCCWANYPIGNLNTSTMDEIWNGSLLTKIRELVSKGETHSMCKNAACPYIQKYKK